MLSIADIAVLPPTFAGNQSPLGRAVRAFKYLKARTARLTTADISASSQAGTWKRTK